MRMSKPDGEMEEDEEDTKGAQVQAGRGVCVCGEGEMAGVRV